uniref:DNA-directed RNA polymerase I subunit rpa49 n=1 Tax=Gossypium raimondii TaxID=29730 RepID=A0A0D2RPQ2_GOSRA|nr:hypothetical protein B456_003G182300 [Gossypium raimondii]
MDEQPSASKSRTQKSKKRSRDGNQNPGGAKHENLQVKIQLFQDQPNKIPPLVAYFPSGYNPQTQQRQDEEESNNQNNSPKVPKVKVFRNMAQRKGNRLQVVVSPGGSNVDFVGSSFTGEAAAAQVCRYSLGVLDKEAGTLKIIPIATNKRKDAINLKKEVDSESQKSLDKKIEEVAFDKEALANTSSLIARNIPPHNVSATTPLEAYPLDKIILKGDWDFLGDIYKLWQGGEKVATNAYPHFVCNRIRKLDAIKDETQQWKLSCILSYITHLMKFRDQFSMGHVKSGKKHNIPSIIHHRFLNLFTDPESKILASEKINLFISYVLVLALHVDGFRTDPSDIAQDLRISKVDLRQHFLNLGCKLVRQNSILYATLPVPLNFPSQNIRRKRRQ